MSDFDKMSHGKRALPEKKPKHLCMADGCEARWTHSDHVTGGIGYCGLHYFWGRGKAEVDAWRERNAMALRDELDMREGKPKYHDHKLKKDRDPVRERDDYEPGMMG